MGQRAKKYGGPAGDDIELFLAYNYASTLGGGGHHGVYIIENSDAKIIVTGTAAVGMSSNLKNVSPNTKLNTDDAQIQQTMRVDHIAIAVNNVQEALKNYQKILNIDEVEIEDVPSEKVKVAMLMLEDTRLELMEPTSPDSPISGFLKDRGEGIHHIAITADDIEKDVARASSNGMRMLGELRTGSYGRRITFIHPKSLNGVLTEFCEAPPEDGKEE